MSKQLMSPKDSRYVSNDDIWTPAWVFEQLGLTFDLDVASSPLETNVPALKKYTQEDDGLSQTWHGRVWMNPPYSNPTPWVQKWREHGNGVAFLPIAKAYWFMHLWHDPQIKICLLNKHMKFEKPDKSLHGIFMNTVLVAIGQDNIKALYRIKDGYVR
jgi:hypothetical protein